MTKVKKMIAILVCVLLFGTMFTACGKEELPEGIAPLGKQTIVGDKVNFGSYEQDNNTENGMEKITWLVVAVDDGKALLVSEKVLDTKKYNEEKVDITWENSTVRAWLNKDFFEVAFTKKEAKKISGTMISNFDHPKHETPGGNITKDKIFLLSIDEAENYFETDELRRSKGTEYAASSGLKLDKSILYAGNSVWWLRSPGFKAYHACYVNNDGVIYPTVDVNNENFGIRPAMWVKY